MTVCPTTVERLQEKISQGICKAADVLSKMLNVQISLETDAIQACLMSASGQRQLGEHHDVPVSIIELNFEGPLGGTAALIFPAATTDSLAAFLLDINSVFIDVETARLGVVRELGSVLINGVMSEITRADPRSYQYATPQFLRGEGLSAWIRMMKHTDTVLIAETRFIIPEYHIRRPAWLAFEINSVAALQSLRDAQR